MICDMEETIVDDLEGLVEKVRLDFPELDDIPIQAGCHVEGSVMEADLRFFFGYEKAMLLDISVSASRNVENFYERPDDEKKAMIAHELGHCIVFINKLYSKKITDDYSKRRSGRNALMVYRDYNQSVELSDDVKEHLIDNIINREDIRHYISEEVSADEEAVNRGYGKGLLNNLKYSYNISKDSWKPLWEGDPDLDIRIKKIENLLGK